MSEHENHQEPGVSLRNAREAAGLSTKEVADSLNLLVSNVEAIEANNYAHMNARIFVRGYIKSYARFLDLNVEELLRAADERLKGEREDSDHATAVAQKRKLTITPVHIVLAALLTAVLAWGLAHLLLGGNSDATAIETHQSLPNDED